MFKGEHSTTDKVLRFIVIVLGLLIFVMIGLIIGAALWLFIRADEPMIESEAVTAAKAVQPGREVIP